MRTPPLFIVALTSVVLITPLAAIALPAAPALPAATAPPGGPDPARYERTPASVDERGPSLEDALAAVRRLRTEVTYELDGEPARSELEGTGFVIELEGRRCVITLAHVVSEDPSVAGAAGPAAGAEGARARAAGGYDPGAWRRRGKLVSERTFMELASGEVELRLLRRDPAADLAFFLLPDGAAAPALPLPAGDSDRLRVGDFVYLLGRLEGTDHHVRAGIVSAAGPTARIGRIAGARHAFMISAPLTHGDSGSPVVAVRAGRYELVGVAQGRYETAREAGWALRINPVLSTLRESLAGALASAP